MFIIGLGNPGEEYVTTRHNAGRIVLEALKKEIAADDFSFDKKSNALVTKGTLGKKKVSLIMPETFMNKSGAAVKYFVKNEKDAAKLVVIYDDFQLPLGSIRISYNRSSGGHRGLESVIKTLKTEAFLRIRVGLGKTNAKGKVVLPKDGAAVEKFILGKFKEEELKAVKKVAKRAIEAIEMIASESKEKAMSVFNAG